MSTHSIRTFVISSALALAALMSPATQAAEECAVPESGTYASDENYVANLGHMYVTAARATRVADLGSIVVTARRETATRLASLGTMTVEAQRDGVVVANLLN
ncbi:MAG TPA: hypothetical protein VKB41_16725 [Steroidobacteraceae bacterium]|nr:hypothetical protein [Steroidobacteraceae bacterium]